MSQCCAMFRRTATVGGATLRNRQTLVRARRAVIVGLLAATGAVLLVSLTSAADSKGTTGSDKLRGTEGADTIDALAGDDYVAGLGGDDVLNGGPDSDSIDGGPGDDRVYGASCQYGDQDIGRYCDNPGHELLLGGDGDDLVQVNDCVAKGCSDDRNIGLDSILEGGAGNDRLTGGDGGDTLRGGPGVDTLVGLAGDDRLRGGHGEDILDAGSGNDHVFARDGQRDTIDCGPGKDMARADEQDVLIGCERVRMPRRHKASTKG